MKALAGFEAFQFLWPQARYDQFQHIEAAVEVGADRADSVADVLVAEFMAILSGETVVSVSTRAASY